MSLGYIIYVQCTKLQADKIFLVHIYQANIGLSMQVPQHHKQLSQHFFHETIYKEPVVGVIVALVPEVAATSSESKF